MRPYNRGFIGVLVVVLVFVALVWLTFFGAAVPRRWQPTPPSQAIASDYELHADDSGKTFTYPATSRFGVVLDSTKYPPQVVCDPAGILGAISNVPAVPAPYFAVRFEAVTPGQCELVAGAFHATIIVTGF